MMVGEIALALALCISHKIPTAWGLAPAGTCVFDCDVTSIYSKAIPASLGIEGLVGTCDRTVLGETTDTLGVFPVVYIPEDGTWHWIREQSPFMCDKEVKP